MTFADKFLTSETSRMKNREKSNDSTIELRRIMIVTDLSAKSRKTYTYAVRLAKHFGATIHLAHFPRKRFSVYWGASNQKHLKHLRNALASESKHAAFAGLPIGTSVLELSDVARSISAFQQESPCQLIVAHSQAGNDQSQNSDHQLAEKIVAGSAIPVLLFGPTAFDSGIEKPENVLVPFDFSDKATTTFPALRFLSKHYQCSFRLLFIQTFRCHWFQAVMDGNEIQIQSFEKKYEELIATELSTLKVELEIHQGLREMEFCNRATDSSTDLIVIGTYGRLGRLTKGIIRNSKCPVMAVPIRWTLD